MCVCVSILVVHKSLGQSVPGAFFTLGSLFWNQRQDLHVLSLGFRNYAALSIPLQYFHIGDKEPFLKHVGW